MVDRSFEIVCPVCFEVHAATLEPGVYLETGIMVCGCGTELSVTLEIEITEVDA